MNQSPLIGKRAVSTRRNAPTLEGVVSFLAVEGGGTLEDRDGFLLEAFAYLLCDDGVVAQVPLASLTVSDAR